MKVIKHGEQRLFEADAETAAVVNRMLLELFWLPITITASASGTRSFTASWRFCVA
jgi:hypothetical protein